MECDFCGNLANEILPICCPAAEKTCLDCVTNHFVSSATMCSECGRQIGKNIKPLIQRSLQAPMQNMQNNNSKRPQNSLYYGQSQPMRQSYHHQNYAPQPNFNHFNYPQYYPPQPQNYSQELPHPYRYQQPMPQQANRPRPRQMTMQGWGSDLACNNRSYGDYQGMNPGHPLYTEAMSDINMFMQSPNYHPQFGLEEKEGEQEFYHNGQMKRVENLTTDNLHEARRTRTISRNNSSINLHKN